MKSRETALRLKRFEATEKSRKVEDLEQMIRELDQMVADLDRQITAEEERTGIRDPHHFSYSTFAKAAKQRRGNLHATVLDLRLKLEGATRDRDAALAEMERAATSEPRQQERGRRRVERVASATLR